MEEEEPKEGGTKPRIRVCAATETTPRLPTDLGTNGDDEEKGERERRKGRRKKGRRKRRESREREKERGERREGGRRVNSVFFVGLFLPIISM